MQPPQFSFVDFVWNSHLFRSRLLIFFLFWTFTFICVCYIRCWFFCWFSWIILLFFRFILLLLLVWRLARLFLFFSWVFLLLWLIILVVSLLLATLGRFILFIFLFTSWTAFLVLIVNSVLNIRHEYKILPTHWRDNDQITEMESHRVKQLWEKERKIKNKKERILGKKKQKQKKK